MKLIVFSIYLLLIAYSTNAQSVTVKEEGKSTSIRGLSVVNDKVAWVSGSKGHVGISIDGGQTWAWQQVKGHEQSDFRDVEAFSDKEAVIMSSGTPALILQTLNGGISWQVSYRNDDKAFFLDGLAFYDRRHGVALGDPIDGKFLLLKTKDGGKTWAAESSGPGALKDEAAFAASGTSVIIGSENATALILTGGRVSRLLNRSKSGIWNAANTPLAQGQPSKGGFSLAAGGGANCFGRR